MNKILNFLQDASDLYITFTESQICLDLRNKSIIKLESIINSTSPESKDVLYEMLYSWAKDASFTPLYGPFSDKMLEDSVSQNTIKENTARKIICSIEEIIFSLNKDDREIFIKRLFKRVLPFFHNYNNFNFVNMLPTYVSQVYTQKEERDNVWNLLKNIFLTTHCIKDLILSTIDICKDFGIDIYSIINEIGIVDFDCFLLKENSLPLKIEETRKKQAKGSLLQQWVVIRNLMECAVDWRLTDDNNNLMYNKTDVARFLSFICGGSEDRIRKRLDEEISSKEMNEIIPYLESIGLHKIAERLKK